MITVTKTAKKVEFRGILNLRCSDRIRPNFETRIRPKHLGPAGSVAATLGKTTNFVAKTKRIQGQFVDSYDPTIENTFSKNLKYKGQEYDVLVVDTAGQDEYSIFPTQYSVDIDGYILVYSIDSEQSFEVVQVYLRVLVFFCTSLLSRFTIYPMTYTHEID